MPALKHTLMREDISTVNARQFSAERTSTTILIALDSIGSLYRTLLLTDEEDGIWTIDVDITIPVNVVLEIPLGVTLTGPGNIQILGGLQTLRWSPHLGPGILIVGGSSLETFMPKLEVDVLYARVAQFDLLRVDTYATFGSGRTESPGPIPDWAPAPNMYYDILIAANQVSEGGGQVINVGAFGAYQWTVLTSDSLDGSVANAAAMNGILDTGGFHFKGGITTLSLNAQVYGTGGLVDRAAVLAISEMPLETSTIDELIGIWLYSIWGTTGTADATGIVNHYVGLWQWDIESGRCQTYIHGIRSDISYYAGQDRWNLYMAGTAHNYIAANLLIGATTPFTWKLFVNGSAAKPTGGSWTDSASMASLKTNIRPLTGALSQLLALQGRQWEWAHDQEELLRLWPGTRVGFVIEEVEPVRPAWVSGGEGEQKGLTISGFEALTVEALRELDTRLKAIEGH